MGKERSSAPKMGMRRGGPHGMHMSAEKAKDAKGSALRLLAYLRPFRRGLAVVICLALLSTVFGTVGPKILGIAVDELFNGMMAKLNHVAGAAINFGVIVKILLILLAIYLVSAVFGYLQEYMMAGISQRIVQQMRNDVSNKLNRLPLKYFDTKTYGEILSRVTNDIDTISNTFEQSLVQVITSVVALLGITIIMLTISPLLSLVAFLVLPLGIVVAAVIAKNSQKHFTGQQSTLGELNGYVEEMYAGHNVVRAFSYEKESIAKFTDTNNRLYKHGWKAQFFTSVIYPALNFISNIAFVGVCVLGGYLTATGRITLGSVQAFITYSRQFNQPIMQVGNMLNILQATLAAVERVFEVLDEEEEQPDTEHPLTIASPHGAVKFNDISFRYKPDTPLIEHVSIDVEPGQLIAIVGPTGAGKTTLVNLLMRFYELDKGCITLDGVSIAKLTRSGLRKHMGMVLQDTWLFKGTIWDNIAYGKEGATDEEVVHAAKVALADPFIRTLPDGYQTIINEDGSNISQGQKQLLTIARAVIANPEVMILDEATSSVDTRTEMLIQHAMKRLMRQRTSFVIAHRLSTIRSADCILVMQNGQIVEQGTHNQLLAMKGAYAALYNSQFAGAE